MSLRPVTDPALLAALEAAPAAPPPPAARKPVTDPALLAQLEGPGRGMDLAAPFDLAATGLSRAIVGVTEPVVGVASRLAGRDYRKDKQDYRDTFTYQPQTEGARETIKAASDFVAPITKPVGEAVGKGINYLDESIGKYAGKTAQTGVREFVNAGADVLGVIPGVAASAKAVTSVTERAAASAALDRVARTPLKVAESLGIKVSPNSVKQTTNSGGSPSLAAKAVDAVGGDRSNIINQRANRAVVNNIAAQEIGLPAKAPLGEQAFATAGKPFAESYQRIRDAIPRKVAPDQKFLSDVGRAGRGTESTLRLPESVNATLEDVSGPMTGGEMLDTIADLRRKGFKGVGSDSVDQNAIGSAQLDLANALEARMDREIARSAPALAGEYQVARKGFAKIYAVEGSMVGNDVNHAALVRINKKSPGMLDGGLKALAETAEHFPDEFSLAKTRVNDASGLGLVSTAALAVRHPAGKIQSWTRGEAKSPRLGEDGPLSYYYRGDGESGLLKREPMMDWDNLLPGKADTAPDLPPRQPPRWPPPSTGVAVVPGQGVNKAPRGNPNAAASGELGYGPDVAAAGARHPGGTPLGGHEPPLDFARSLEDYIAKQKGDGINFENVLIEPTKRRTSQMARGERQRGVKQGEKVGNRENVRAEAGARERGMALELSLQGKKVPRDKETARARSIKNSQKKKK